MFLSRIATAFLIAAILIVLAYLLTGCYALNPGSGPAGGQGAPPAASTGITWLTVSGGVATAAGVAVSAVPAIGPAIGMPVAIGGAALLVLSLTLAKYGGFIALIGLVVLIGGVAIVALRKLATYKGALIKVVESVQELKTTFGLDNTKVNAVLADAQGSAAARLVSAVKRRNNI